MLNIGDKIGKYKITKEVNTGGFCNAYFVRDSSETYFLKEYSEPKEADPIFRSFYDNQCIIIERLNRMASIAEKYVDHFITSGIYYQVKVKLKGINLETYFESSPDYENRKELGIIFCGIIKNLHSNGIVHQDLKPAQLMLVDDEIGKKTKLGYRIVLSDFDWSIPDGKVVQIIGTPYYKSPEHYRNETPVYASDIFTVGIMLYELLTGRNPFDFDDTPEDEQIKHRVLKGKIYKPPQKVNEEINDQINSVIIKCLDPVASNRPGLEEIQSTLLGLSDTAKVSNAPKIPETSIPASSAEPKNEFAKFSIACGGQKLIIFKDKEIGRHDFKLFFSDAIDKNGNSLHTYCDVNQSMLLISKEDDGSFMISAPNTTKNYFLLNSRKIGNEKQKLSIGDTLDLFSTTQAIVIGSFKIQPQI